MTDDDAPVRCGWCHRPLAARPGAGRPRRFCSPSHRQRAYEARRRAAASGLAEDRCIVATADLARLHDRLYRLESAVEDVGGDLAEDSSTAAVRAALDHVLDAAGDLVGFTVEPVRG